MNKFKGHFITFEGGDGAGKSTQIRILQERLTDRGYEVIATREPGGTQISENIREILLDPENTDMDPMTETMLYAAARAQLVSEVIRPALERGAVVICDRFVDSSIAYQGHGRGLGDAVSQINAHGIGDCMPDLTIYLHLDPGIGSQRIGDREKDRIEQEDHEFHLRVSEGFRRQVESDPGRIFVVDAVGSIQEIADRIEEKVMEIIHEV